MVPRRGQSHLGQCGTQVLNPKGKDGSESPRQPMKTIFRPDEVAALCRVLKGFGYRLVGPRVLQGDFVYRELDGAEDLPWGWGMDQEAGTFRLIRRMDQAGFGYTVGQDSWKKFFLPPEHRLWEARKTAAGWEFLPVGDECPPLALIGVRPCDLAALAVLDRVLLAGRVAEPTYQNRRRQALVVAVNCTEPGPTCFCASLGTGPRAAAGFDLALTEMISGTRHWFLVEAGSDRGLRLLEQIPGRRVDPRDAAAADQALGQAATRMGRGLDTQGLKELLYANYEHRQWAVVAARCLSCGNCASVCPTCFCHTIEDTLNLKGDAAQRWRRQDVCFTLEHSYLHGGSVRTTPRARYRQWLTHKLATWQDQFGCLGCVGCGRCITWCPVGIDLTAEAAAIRREPGAVETPSAKE